MRERSSSLEATDCLALAVRAGETGSMERLVRSYQDQIYAFALRLLRNAFDAQEVAQDTFMNAHQALTRRYDEETCRKLALRPWLFRIAHNLAHNRLRAHRSSRQEPLPPDDQFHAGTNWHGSNPADALEKDQRRQLLNAALTRLKPGVRELIVLRFYEELPFAEIAGILGIDETAARGKAFRALRELRRHLARTEV